MTSLRTPKVASAATVAATLAVSSAPTVVGGSESALLGVSSGVAAVTMLLRPRLGIFALLVTTGTLLPTRVGGFDLAGVRSDVPEALVLVLLAAWMLRKVLDLSARSRETLLAPLVAVVAAGFFGAAVAITNGATTAEILGPLKTFAFWLLPLPLLAELRARSDVDRLVSTVVGLATISAGLTIFLAAVGFGIPHAETNEVVTTGLTSAAQRIRPAALQLQFLATLLLAHRAGLFGWTKTRTGALLLLLIAQALSFNRSTWLALAVVLVIYGVRRPGPRNSAAGLRTVLIAAGALAAALIVAASGILGPTSRSLALRAASTANPAVFQERSQTLRNEESRIARSTIARRPLTGVGLNQPYGSRRGQYSESLRGRIYFDHRILHNTFLKIWLDTGLPGVVAFGWLGWRLWGICRRRRNLPDYANSLVLANVLALVGFALQAIYQTKLYHRPTIVAMGIAMAVTVAANRVEFTSPESGIPAEAPATAAPST